MKDKNTIRKWEDENVWVGDTGASSHLTHIYEGFSSTKDIKGTKANFGKKGDNLNTMIGGTWKGRIYELNNTQTKLIKGQKIQLKDTVYVPDIRQNLFSITREISLGAELINQSRKMILKYPDKREIILIT